MWPVLVRAWGAVCALTLCASVSFSQPPRPSPAPPAPHAAEAEATTLLVGGKQHDALKQLDRAWAAYVRAGDRVGQARVALRRGQAHRALGQQEAAIRHTQQARALAAEDLALQVSALTQLSLILGDRGDLAAADAALREALPIAERSGDAAAQIRVLRAMGVASGARGRQQEALEQFKRAATAADRSGDAALRVLARDGLSVTLMGLSRYDEALAAAEESGELSRGARAGVRAGSLFQLAQAYNQMWNLDRAAELWPDVIAAYREAGDLRGRALAVMQSVYTWFALGEFERAVVDGEHALDLLGQAGVTPYVAETLGRLALSSARAGRLEQAAAWSVRARDALPSAPVSRHLFVHNDLGLVAIELREFDRARAHFTRVADVAREIGNVEYEWRAAWGFGRTAIAERKPADAVAPLETAIRTIDRLRQTIPAASERAAFMTQRVGPYESLVEALIDRASSADDPDVARALEIAEQSRSRALADLLAESRARMRDPRLQTIREREIAAGRRFSEIQKHINAAADEASRTAGHEELLVAEREYEELVRRVRRESPAYAALAYPRPLSSGDISSALAADEALVEFLITAKRGFAWVVRRDGIRTWQVPGHDELQSQMRLLQALLPANDLAAIEALGQRFYRQLLAPAESSLRGARRLIVVPDGPLQRLPLALLRVGDAWLIERYALALAPSATILAYLRATPRTRASEPLLALAAPDLGPAGTGRAFATRGIAARPLTHAVEEAQAARRLAGARGEDILVGGAATERALHAANVGRYRILHVAAHAVIDEIAPRRSAVLLAPDKEEDGLLQVNEIANLSLNADLVVLAACQSQVGRVVRGEGLLSLSRAFMHGGARAVVATLWPVDDRATSQVMQWFYRGLRDGRTPDEALRAAQIRALRSGGPIAAPATWAPFLISGETSAPILDPAPTISAWILGALVATALSGTAVAILFRRRRASRAPVVSGA
jgi:CHAT domain-containing protein/tetratricopeptide (TPR) repeat protein